MIDYDPHDWWYHFFAVRGTMLTDLAARIGMCAAIATVVAWANHEGYAVGMPATPHTLVGAALGLLLVFRTNASYDRFWEGRKLWGGIVNETRNLVRQAAVLYGRDELFPQLVRWTTAFPFACMHALRGARVQFPDGLIAKEDSIVVDEQNVPLAVAVRMTANLREARSRGLLSDIQQMEADRNIGLLIDYLGGCERIHKTPLPFAYVVHLRRAVVLYCFSLPFGLVQAMGYWSILATATIAFTLFGIEEIGVEIEDPFGTDSNDLPLERICETIAKNLESVRPI